MKESFNQQIEQMLKKERGNKWLMFETMQTYIRVGRRLINGQSEMCIQLANLSTNKQRQGTFTRLVANLQQYNLPLYLENVLSPEWQMVLIERHGWKMVRNHGLEEFNTYGLVNDLVKQT